MSGNLISRYASPPVTLRVGTGLQPYYVPEVLLQSLHNLPRSLEFDRTIDLRDVDIEIAHIIVHFLYTGQYQTLPSDDGDAPSSSKPNFKKAIAVFIASKKYGLEALKELARLEAQHAVGETSVIQVVHAVGKKTLATLLEDAGWLQNLVLQRAERAFEEGDEVFSSASFFAGVENLTLAKLLGQRVAMLYRGRVSQLHQQLGTTNGGLEVAVNGANEDATDKVSHETDQDLSENAAGTTVPANCNDEVVNGGLLSSQATGTEVNGALSEAILSILEQDTESPVVHVVNAIAEPTPTVAKEAWISIQPPPISKKQQANEDPATNAPVISDLPLPDEFEALYAHFEAKTGPFQDMKSNKARILLKKALRTEIVAKAREVVKVQAPLGPAE